MNKNKILKNLIKEKKLIYVMGAHNGLSAKLVEKNGYDAIWASGLEISASFALPDANILTMTEYLEKSSEMNDSTNLPVISDCDTGYGNSNNVIHMIKKYESAGIASVCIEDKLFPKVNSFVKGRQELAPIAEFVGKIMAAKSVQQTKDFMLIARTEALIAGWEMDEALLRSEKYVEAGADAILIHSKRSDYDEILKFVKLWDHRAPLIVIPTTYPALMKDFSDEQLLKLGINMVIFANQGIRASIKAMDRVMGHIRQTRGSSGIENEIAPLREVFELQGMVEMKDKEQKFLKTDASEFNVVFLAAGSPNNQEDLKPLLRDRPVAQLDINGQPLIKRNISTLSRFSVKDIAIVTGYKSEQFNNENVTLIHNPDYQNKKILHSLMLAQDFLKGKTLLAYADVLFDRNIIERLLKCDEDIVVVGDPTFKKMNVRNKKLDLIVADEEPANSHRTLEHHRLRKAVMIGENVAENQAHFEFSGLTLFSEKGIQQFRKTFEDMKQKNRLPKGNGKSVDQWNIYDVLQEVIHQGFAVHVLEVNSGWMEIHTFENYKAACQLLSKHGE